MTKTVHSNLSIRRIAAKVAGEETTDYEITKVAASMGCQCPVVEDLNKLTMWQRVSLLKFMIAEGQKAGYTLPQMARF